MTGKSRIINRCGALVILLALAACSTTQRPTPPPEGAPVTQAWGTVPILARRDVETSLSESLVSSLQAKFAAYRADNPNGKVPYRALALSGGGSRGAYGAGVMSGWTDAGDRPQFDVVTGVSTGALMATHVFLGSEFDDGLSIYARLTNRDVYSKQRLVSILRAGAAYDTSPLRETITSLITMDILEEVAAEHRAGRRLFVGSTNLDANLFTIWDLGSIANSGRPDRRERYIDALMASAAFPIAFRPVYIEVEGENGTHTQMHADGGIRETAFYFDFIEELHAAAEAANLSKEDFKQEFFLLINGTVAHSEDVVYEPVDGRLKDVTTATIGSLMTRVTRGSVFRMWVLAMVDGSDFHISYIPSDFEFNTHTLQFEPEEEKALFELGYEQALRGSAWVTQRAPETTEEVIERIADPVSAFDVQDRHRTMLKREN